MRLLFELSIASLLLYGVLYFRKQYFEAVIHHKKVSVLWQRMMFSIMSEQISHYFKETIVTNHIIQLKNGKTEISIGDNDVMVPVDMELFKEDIAIAFNKAYNILCEVKHAN